MGGLSFCSPPARRFFAGLGMRQRGRVGPVSARTGSPYCFGCEMRAMIVDVTDAGSPFAGLDSHGTTTSAASPGQRRGGAMARTRGGEWRASGWPEKKG